MHFCKNFFIRDRLEQSNERLPQNLENLYRKKKICSNKNSLLSYKPWNLLNNCSTKVFQNFSHNTRLCFRCWWLFWWCVCVCVCLCVFMCLRIFVSVCKNPYFWFQPMDLYKGKKKEASPMNFMGFVKWWGFWKLILYIIFTSSEYLLSHFHVLEKSDI